MYRPRHIPTHTLQPIQLSPDIPRLAHQLLVLLLLHLELPLPLDADGVHRRGALLLLAGAGVVVRDLAEGHALQEAGRLRVILVHHLRAVCHHFEASVGSYRLLDRDQGLEYAGLWYRGLLVGCGHLLGCCCRVGIGHGLGRRGGRKGLELARHGVQLVLQVGFLVDGPRVGVVLGGGVPLLLLFTVSVGILLLRLGVLQILYRLGERRDHAVVGRPVKDLGEGIVGYALG